MNLAQTQWNQPRAPQPLPRGDTISWRGASGERYAFILSGFVAFAAKPGIYAFCKLTKTGLWRPLYIGETDSFERRIGGDLTLHRHWSSIRAQGATHIATHTVHGTAAQRIEIVTDLRARYHPVCNES
jgi:hypothetical protein